MIEDDDFPGPTLVLDYTRSRAERAAYKLERFLRFLETYQLPRELDPWTGLPVDDDPSHTDGGG